MVKHKCFICIGEGDAMMNKHAEIIISEMCDGIELVLREPPLGYYDINYITIVIYLDNIACFTPKIS
jgi:hypothetical protein